MPCALAQPKHASLEGVPSVAYELIESKPGDPDAYTQGFQLVEGVLYWGTGLYGKSEVMAVDWETGEVKMRRKLPKESFGEGVTVWNGNVYQLTWRVGLLYVYKQSDFSLVDIFVYEGEGWGLTHNGEQFVMSNGTSMLTFRNSESFAVERELQVTSKGQPINHINELEWIEGWIFANRWGASDILVIHPENGHVVAQIQLDRIAQEVRKRYPNAEVLNGVAFDAKRDCILLTGKHWDRIYCVKVNFEEL